MGDVEGGPKGVFLYIAAGFESALICFAIEYPEIDDLLAWISRSATPHSTDAADQTHTQHKPRISSHQPITPSVHVQSAGSDTNDSYTESSMQKGIIQVSAFIFRHAAIFPHLAIEHEVDADQRGAEDTRSIEQTLPQFWIRIGRRWSLLHVGPSEGRAEDIVRFCERGRGLPGEEVGGAFEWRGVESS